MTLDPLRDLLADGSAEALAVAWDLATELGCGLPGRGPVDVWILDEGSRSESAERVRWVSVSESRSAVVDGPRHPSWSRSRRRRGDSLARGGRVFSTSRSAGA